MEKRIKRSVSMYPQDVAIIEEEQKLGHLDFSSALRIIIRRYKRMRDQGEDIKEASFWLANLEKRKEKSKC